MDKELGWAGYAEAALGAPWPALPHRAGQECDTHFVISLPEYGCAARWWAQERLAGFSNWSPQGDCPLICTWNGLRATVCRFITWAGHDPLGIWQPWAGPQGSHLA